MKPNNNYKRMKFTIIGAYASSNRAIGYKNRLLWSNRDDMIYFKTTTSDCPSGNMNAIIMGRNTFDSIGKKPLPNRVNIVLTSNPAQYSEQIRKYPELIVCCSTLSEVLKMLDSIPYIYKCFVIGGENLYKQAIHHEDCERILVNEIMIHVPYENIDAWFPEIPTEKYELVQKTKLTDIVTNYEYHALFEGVKA